jgi:hypothetical protein
MHVFANNNSNPLSGNMKSLEAIFRLNQPTNTTNQVLISTKLQVGQKP